MTSSVESLYEMFLSDPDIVATATKSREEVAFGEAKQRFIQSMNNHKALSLAKSGRLEDLLSYLRYGNLMKGPKDTLHVFGTGESIGPGSAFPSSRITHRMPEAIVNPRGQIRYIPIIRRGIGYRAPLHGLGTVSLAHLDDIIPIHQSVLDGERYLGANTGEADSRSGIHQITVKPVRIWTEGRNFIQAKI